MIKEDKMSLIKIFVTHISNREDEVIDNPLYIDVIAGADYQKKPIPENWVTDNTGENISSKNNAYCELSTQYWAWKNVDSEYYGFCHYRRYLSLSNNEYESNDPSGRGQIYVKNLNSATAHKYYLDDEEKIRNYIEKYDVILPKKQNLSILPTPLGKQNSVYKHFAAHDRLFMNKSDLEVLIKTISGTFPEYLDDAKEFLNGKYFWGYSCFVLRKKYFNELCEFEFSILEQLEKEINMSRYNQQQMRMPGFMGEILSGIYFYHLIKTHPSLKVAETQLIYFAKTDKMISMKSLDKVTIPYIFNVEQIPEFMFLPTIESFLKKISSNRKYDLYILHWNMKKNYQSYYQNLLKQYSNLRVSFIDNQDIYDTFVELGLNPIDTRLVLPWILPNYEKAMVLNWNLFFNKAIDDIEQVDLNDKLVAGSKGVLKIGMANDVSDQYETYLREKLNIENKYDLVDTNAFLMNLEKFRSKYSCKDIIKKLKEIEFLGSFDEALNSIVKDDTVILEQKWNYFYTENAEEIRVIKQIPRKMLEDYNSAKKCAKIISYNSNFVWNQEASEYNLKYWNFVKTTDFYHLFLAYFNVIIEHSTDHISTTPKSLIKKIIGALKCVLDHGFLYTIKYAYKRLCKI